MPGRWWRMPLHTLPLDLGPVLPDLGARRARPGQRSRVQAGMGIGSRGGDEVRSVRDAVRERGERWPGKRSDLIRRLGGGGPGALEEWSGCQVNALDAGRKELAESFTWLRGLWTGLQIDARRTLSGTAFSSISRLRVGGEIALLSGPLVACTLGYELWPSASSSQQGKCHCTQHDTRSNGRRVRGPAASVPTDDEAKRACEFPADEQTFSSLRLPTLSPSHPSHHSKHAGGEDSHVRNPARHLSRTSKFPHHTLSRFVSFSRLRILPILGLLPTLSRLSRSVKALATPMLHSRQDLPVTVGFTGPLWRSACNPQDHQQDHITRATKFSRSRLAIRRRNTTPVQCYPSVISHLRSPAAT